MFRASRVVHRLFVARVRKVGMSARMPFIPTGLASRPPSRAVKLKDQPHNLNSKNQNPHSSTNPSSGTPSLNSQQPIFSSQNKTHESRANSFNDGGVHRPLNTGGLLKKKNPTRDSLQTPNTFPPNMIMLPGTVDPNAKSHQDQSQKTMPNHDQLPKIIAPVPRQPLRPSSPVLSNNHASGVFSSISTNFKTPLPISLPQKPNQEENSTKGAHTPTSILGFSFSKARDTIDQRDPQLPSPPTSIRTSSSRIYESQANASADHQHSHFTLNPTLLQSGPRHVALDPEVNNGKPDNSNVQTSEIDLGGRTNQEQQQLKRPRPEPEDEPEIQVISDGYQTHSKRYKNIEGYKSNIKPTSSPQHPPSPSHPRPDYHRSRSRSPRSITYSPQVHRHRRRQPLTPPSPQFRHEHQPTYQFPQGQSIPVNGGSGVLNKLLGRDTDEYIEENMDKYEQAIGRWKDCSMDDWVAGADELAARYGKILDFVKTHMVAKMKLFASLEAKIDSHNATLDERDKVLEGVRKRLVHESGNVLGRGGY